MITLLSATRSKISRERVSEDRFNLVCSDVVEALLAKILMLTI